MPRLVTFRGARFTPRSRDMLARSSTSSGTGSASRRAGSPRRSARAAEPRPRRGGRGRKVSGLSRAEKLAIVAAMRRVGSRHGCPETKGVG